MVAAVPTIYILCYLCSEIIFKQTFLVKHFEDIKIYLIEPLMCVLIFIIAFVFSCIILRKEKCLDIL